MAFATVDNPELYFQSVLWTGNQSTQAITFDGSEDMQPDWVWVKQRADDGYSHELFDSVRGVTKYIVADTNASETTGNTTLTAFGSDGFTLGADTIVNKNTKTYVSWNWKMGTAFSNDASATSVGSIDSSGSINTTAGFSIQIYTVTGKVVNRINRRIHNEGFRSEGIIWDGRDEFGEKLSKGVYVYNLHVTNEQGLTADKTETMFLLK